MKKVIFIVMLAFAGKVGVAQTEYKLEKGNVTTELQLSLFNTGGKMVFDEDGDFEYIDYSTSGPLSLSGFRLRYALNNKWALRTTVGLDFGHSTSKRDWNDTFPSEPGYYKWVYTGNNTDKSKYTEFSIAPGFEYHFGNWERMSVYVGGEVFFGMRTTQGTSKNERKTEYFERMWGEEDYVLMETTETSSSLNTKNCNYYESSYYAEGTQTGVMTFGVNAIVGMDFYVYKGLYLGAELGLGYQHASLLKGSVNGGSKTTTRGFDGEVTNYLESKVDKKFDDQLNTGRLAFKCNPMIRLGWKF
ncbi:MAG: hypothetical protein FWH36_01430 [Lentimicrobiaceae bacterium]|nr:hypothetical protein [Lentimicrobiaceae bacterium]